MSTSVNEVKWNVKLMKAMMKYENDLALLKYTLLHLIFENKFSIYKIKYITKFEITK